MIERYETEYGIYDHDDTSKNDPNDTLTVLKQWDAEDPYKFSMYRKRVKEYVQSDVQKYLGLSFDEFLHRPRAEVEILLETCRGFQAEENKREQERLRRMEASTEVRK